MLGIDCDVCNGLAIFDEVATRMAYTEDANYMIDEVGKIIEETLQQYLIYTCMNCNTQYNLTYKEWELRTRERLAKEVMEARKFNIFKGVVDPSKVDPDNGLEWCGKCSGVDNEGNCYSDIIKVCTIINKEL